ncbi:MAG: FAD:protein FMN transferase [Thermoguttaceae bacterium]|jgi:thiamine biosynthesis lipoprotein|nr:FAD:protein FMN transferase [Thermoguttaceae bacterium]
MVGTVASANPPEDARLERFEFTRVEMAMPVRIVLYSDQKEVATRAATAALDRFRELNGVLSDYDAESELNRLCRTAGSGACVPISDDLWQVLARAWQVSEASGGAFDVTIGPVSRLWRRARRRREIPPAERIKDALQRVDYRFVKLDPARQCITLQRGGMQIDLGGIGKGYAIDQALLTLQKKGIERALVDAAGDIGVSGAPPGMTGWRIAIASLDPAAPPEAFLWLSHGAVAHSGDLWQHVEIDGKRYSHIVDPKTGIGLTDHSSVTVVASDAITADALASAVSVLGPERGLALLESTPGVAGRIMHAPEGRTKSYESSAWKDLDFAPAPDRPSR